MSAQIKSSKEDKQRAVSKAILEVIEREGLLGVTHSKVSRKSGVSRAWIYEYIGTDKDDLIEFAAEVFAIHFSRAKADLPQSKEQLRSQLNEGLQFLFESVASDPVIVKLYFRFRGSQNAIGEVIKKYEKRWLENAAKSAAELLSVPAEQARLLAELLLTLRLGFAHRFATSAKPQEARESAEKIFELIHQFIPT